MATGHRRRTAASAGALLAQLGAMGKAMGT